MSGVGAGVLITFSDSSSFICNLFFYLLQMTASVAHIVVYGLLLAALTAFDESTLARNDGEMQVSHTEL